MNSQHLRAERVQSLDVRPGSNRLFQTSTMAALLDAVYDGEMAIEELLQHGDFGLGTFNALDGEMIINNGVAHQFRSEGAAHLVSHSELSPFACVTQFKPERRFQIEAPMDLHEFEHRIEELAGNQNLIVALRFTGTFEFVVTRTVFCQCQPYPKMLDVVARQPVRHFSQTAGTMLGFRTPGFMQGLNVAGFHLHFLNGDATRGGHVTDYRLLSGEVEMAIISDVEICLPRTEAFAKADLTPPDLHDAIRVAEGG